MKKLIALLSVILIFLAADSFARGGGGFSGGRSSFGGGRSSFGGGSFGGGRSSFGGGRSAPTSPSKPSSPSPSSRGGWFGSSSKGKFGNGNTNSKGGTFSSSPRGKTTPPTTKEVLYSSPTVISTPYHSVPIYYYYYPTPYYGSGYSFYQWYYWSHWWGNHSHCYHQGGGQATVRKCDEKVANSCYQGEYCEVKTHECKLKQ